MSWQRAVLLTPCSWCQEPIGPGELYRRGDYATRYVWCLACAKDRLDEGPPDTVGYLPVAKTGQPGQFDKAAMAATLKAAILRRRREVIVIGGED